MTESEKISELLCHRLYCYWCNFHNKERTSKNCIYYDFYTKLEKEKQNKERDTKDEIHKN